MSINWVMLDAAQGFVSLPGERAVYRSPPRTSLSLTTPKSYPAASGNVSISADSGTLYLTNQRLVYIPTKASADFQSFAAPLSKLHDTHITVPWFGPNAWVALVEPVPGGNLPAVSTGIELKLTFKEGGAPDFHSNFERIKERLLQALDTARESGVPTSRQADFFTGVNMNTVHLDQLPSYEASGQDRVASPAEEFSSVQSLPTNVETPPTSITEHVQTGPSGHPVDAPPGYEETQTQSIQQELDRRLSGS